MTNEQPSNRWLVVADLGDDVGFAYFGIERPTRREARRVMRSYDNPRLIVMSFEEWDLASRATKERRVACPRKV